MTQVQARKKCEVARKTGSAYIDKDTMLYYGHTGDPTKAEYSLQSKDGLHWNTILTTSLTERIVALISD